MRKQKTTKLYRTRVTLRLRGARQVIDTLRYESMVPDTQEDASKLESLLDGGGLCEITFRRYAMNPGGPTEARLASYLIELVSWEPVE